MRKPRSSQSPIIGWLLLALLPWLGGCSALRMSYDNGPQLTWWWLDGYVDFSRDQAGPVKQGLQSFFAWHRRTQLPAMTALLDDAAADVTAPTTPAQVCRWQARIRDALEPALEQALSQGADFVPGLGEPQFRAIDRKFAKVMDDMRDDYLQPDRAERRAVALRRTVERVERLYGRLGDAQREVIAAGLADSPFDPEAWAAERRRRQRDTLHTLRRLVAEHATHAEIAAALRALVARDEESPDPGYRAYQIRLDAYNCVFGARIHNATTAAQRRHAHDTLAGWADDFRDLLAEPSGGPSGRGG